MPVKYSDYQLNLFNLIENSNRSILCKAAAGAGKTTSIVHGVNRLPKGLSVLFLAFNKKIVEELSSKLPRHIDCKTFNSCGWGAWRSYTGKKFIKVNANKTKNLLYKMVDKEEFKIYVSFVSKMVGLAKHNGLSHESPESSWWEISEHHNVSLSCEDANYDRAMQLCFAVMRKSIEIADKICDFDDQIFMPFLKGATFPKYNAIFLDEGQDTNPIQIELLKRMLKPGGRIIAVGDEDQSIYGFRGADHTAMSRIQKEFDCVEAPLSICYRCAKNIVIEAQKYSPKIEFFEGSPDGVVEVIDKYDIDFFREGDAILCRNTAPLIKIAYQIISRGKSVIVLGRDIGVGLVSMIKNMEAKSVDHLQEKMGAWFEKESEKLSKKNQEDKIAILQDKVNCIDIFISNLPISNRNINGLISAIEYLFQNKNGGIILCTAHRSKGHEWERVFILDFNQLMPSKYAKKEWQKIQEKNLIYVAITRAKRMLGYINSNCWTDSSQIIVPERNNNVINSERINLNKKMKGFNPFALESK